MDKKTKEAIEILDAIGQENEKEGIRATKHFVDQFDRREWNSQQLKQGKLSKARFSKRKYYEMLASMLHEEAQDLEIPLFYKIWATYTDQGVVIFVTGKDKRRFTKAFTPCGEPKKDYAAVVHLLVSAQNQIDELEQEKFRVGTPAGKKTKSGIYI